jgi:ubiquinone/menaquinone biosynthesis C-methylase UbiE
VNAPSDALLERLRCPVSGEPLFLEGEQLVSESGKHRYELRAGRIPLFCEDPASVGARRQQAHYDRVAAAYLENLAYPHTREYTAHLDRVLFEALGPGSLGAVAEICCGQGEALALLGDRIEAGVGVDISVSMLEAAAARLPESRFALLQADATRLPLADAQFDHVVMLGGIHHVGDRRGLFREVARILRPGGRFVWREPVSDFPLWRALRAVVYRLSPALDHATERPLLRRETEPPLREAGLEPGGWRTCGFLGFCLLMNSDVLVWNRALRFLPGAGALARAAAAFDAWCLRLPGLGGAGLQVVGWARKPGSAGPAGAGAAGSRTSLACGSLRALSRLPGRPRGGGGDPTR